MSHLWSLGDPPTPSTRRPPTASQPPDPPAPLPRRPAVWSAGVLTPPPPGDVADDATRRHRDADDAYRAMRGLVHAVIIASAMYLVGGLVVALLVMSVMLGWR